jgi:hypothetical protein
MFMGIPAEKWTLLYEDMKPYMTRVYDGNLTIEEYLMPSLKKNMRNLS